LHLLQSLTKNFTLQKIDLEYDAPTEQSSFRIIEMLFDTLNLVKIDQQRSSVFSPIRSSTKKKIEALLEGNRGYKKVSGIVSIHCIGDFVSVSKTPYIVYKSI
jgi:hypothetical protein